MMRAKVKVFGVILLILFFLSVDIPNVCATESSNEIPELSNALELNNDNLNDTSNYREGWYKSWGGSYELTGGGYCSKTYYVVEEEQYYFYANDSRVIISISEYNGDGKWTKYNSGLKSGDVFVKQSNTEYIAITLKSLQWGVNVMDLFRNGLIVNLSNTPYVKELKYESYDSVNFLASENWSSGSYSAETGEYMIKQENVCYRSYISIDDNIYKVKLPNSSMKMRILELDSEGKAIRNNELYAGESWKKREGTSYIAVTVYRSGLTYDEFVSIVNSGSVIGLQKYTPYVADGVMSELSATEFMKIMNVGWNLGNSLDSKSTVEKRGNDANLRQELNWGNPYITEELVDYIADSGINTIRIPVTWFYNTYEDENGTLRVGDGWLARVKEVVDYAIKNDMYVILNAHHEQPILYAGVEEGEMALVLKRATELWNEIGEYFRDYDEHLIFEGFNEIDNLERSWNYGDLAASQMNQLNQAFVSTVRATGGNNARRILMVPTLLDGTTNKILDAFVLPTDTVQNRLIVQVHTYSQKYHQGLDKNLKALERFANGVGAPVIIGEFGTKNNYAFPQLRAVHASNFVARAAACGIKCVWWDNGSDYGIVNRKDLSQSDTGMIQALLQGSRGLAYEVQDGLFLNNSSQFTLLMPNLQTGALESLYWGTITTEIEGAAITVKESKQCILSLAAVGDAGDIWLQRVLFYDADGNYISGKEIQKIDYICDIPENAAYIRVSMNSPYRSIKWEQYCSYLENGFLELGICFIDAETVNAIQLNINT